MKPYCFVLMPFGRKSDESGKVVEFDQVYEQVIRPAIEDADMEAIRADEELVGGIIHKPMFERLMMCDYAVADLTTANANVFYELGIRHGVRPHSTVAIAGTGMRLPFDVAPLRAIFYEVDATGIPQSPEDVRKILAKRLQACRDPADDSPLYQLLTDIPRPDLQHLKTDRFRELVEYSQSMKARLAKARGEGAAALSAIEREMNIVDDDPAVIIDLYLSYRAIKDWKAMVDLVEKMSPPLQQTILVQEQLAFALNRLGRHGEAEALLKELIRIHGPSSETNGILGRVYKDQWEQARNTGNPATDGYLERAIAAYLEGFEADWRDAYPGINAVTLMEFCNPPDERQPELLPVVAYAVKRRLAYRSPDYWDYATQLELSALSRHEDDARRFLGLALSAVREHWEPETTARNIRLIREARTMRGEHCDWLVLIEEGLNTSAGR